MSRITLKQESQEVESYTFFKTFKFLFTEEYNPMGIYAKMLYSLLRDRHNLSVSNEWTNDKGEIYLIYTREEMCKNLNCSNSTIGKAIIQLRKCKLIEIERRGVNKPNYIYMTSLTLENTLKCVLNQSRVTEYTNPDWCNKPCNKTDLNKNDLNKTDLRYNGSDVDTPYETPDYVSIYRAEYQAYRGKIHPNISEGQRDACNKRIATFLNDAGMDEDTLFDLIEAYFTDTAIETDYNVNHFSQYEILKHRGYTLGYGSQPEGW